MKVLVLSGLFLVPAVLAAAQAPLVEPGGVVDAASFKGPVVPGSLVSIFGSNLASGTASASAIPLPDTLGGASVRFNGIAAPLLYVSGQQIDAQLPWEVPTTGPVSVVVANGAAASAPQSVRWEPSRPACSPLQATRWPSIRTARWRRSSARFPVSRVTRPRPATHSFYGAAASGR